MAENDEVARLRTRLDWETGGPLLNASGQATDAATRGLSAAAAWIGEQGRERPLVSLLLAFQLGFAIGRWGQPRAQGGVHRSH